MGWGALQQGIDEAIGGVKLLAKEFIDSRLVILGNCVSDPECAAMSFGAGTMRTLPTLPGKVIAKEGELVVSHYYRSGDHGPAHAHVTGGGQSTRIGPKGHQLRGDPALSSTQQEVVQGHAKEIRKALNKIGRWLAGQER
jgi:hypothetical protein